MNIKIEAKVVGQKKPVFTDRHVPIPNESSAGGITLRELITIIVVDEVEAFKQRQQERKLVQIVTAEDIQRGVERGKIDLGERDLKQEVDESAAIGTALQAFSDGLYFVFIDDVQHESLDQQVFVGDDSSVLFVRLVALAGG